MPPLVVGNSPGGRHDGAVSLVLVSRHHTDSNGGPPYLSRVGFETWRIQALRGTNEDRAADGEHRRNRSRGASCAPSVWRDGVWRCDGFNTGVSRRVRDAVRLLLLYRKEPAVPTAALIGTVTGQVYQDPHASVSA